MTDKRGIVVEVAGAEEIAVFTADFGQAQEAADGYVVRRGKIFEAGAWPDKKFALTEEEMAAAVADFTPQPVDLEHIKTILSGHLGEVRAIFANGATLDADVAIPTWLDAIFAGSAIKASATWDRLTKKLKGLALVLDPRIADAQLVAAFAEAEPAAFAKLSTDHAQHVQRAHDALMSVGAKCSPDNTDAPPAAKDADEAKMAADVQALLDDAGFVAFANAMQAKHQAWNTQMIHDMATESGAQCNHANTECNNASFAQAKEADPAVAKLRAEVAQLKGEKRQAEAVAFAEAQLAAHKAVPAERETLVAAFVQAAQDDDAHGLATFGSQTARRTDQLAALYAARPAHVMAQETIRPDQHVFYNRDATADPNAPQPMSQTRREELLGATALGRDVLAAK